MEGVPGLPQRPPSRRSSGGREAAAESDSRHDVCVCSRTRDGSDFGRLRLGDDRPGAATGPVKLAWSLST